MLKHLKNGRKLARMSGVGVFLLIPTGLLAVGPQRSEKTIDTTVSPQISVTNVSGKVVVRGWDKPQIHMEYVAVVPSQMGVDVEQLPANSPADKIHFMTYVVDHTGPAQGSIVDYTLQVPTGASLEIRNPQGSVEVDSIQGDTSVESLSGNISVNDATGHLSVRSVGGNIEVTRASGRVEAYSINGNLHFVDPSSSQLQGNTTSGTIVYEGGFVPGGEYILSDYSGNMDIICPPTASFELNAKTVRGKLDNKFPLVSRQPSHPLFPSGNSIFGTHNTGEATLEVTSFSGAIHIHQR